MGVRLISQADPSRVGALLRRCSVDTPASQRLAGRFLVDAPYFRNQQLERKGAILQVSLVANAGNGSDGSRVGAIE